MIGAKLATDMMTANAERTMKNLDGAALFKAALQASSGQASTQPSQCNIAAALFDWIAYCRYEQWSGCFPECAPNRTKETRML